MADKNSGEDTSRVERKKFWNNDMEAVIGIMFVLLILGTINIFSSSFVIGEMQYSDPYYFLKRHMINIAIGFVAFGICVYFDYHIWRKYIPMILIVTVIALVLVLLIGPMINGAKRWLPLGFTQVQPAEFAKLLAIMLSATYISFQLRRRQQINLLSPQNAVILLMAVLTEREPDMGTASIIAGIPLIMLIVAGLPKKQIWILSSVVLLAVAFLIWQEPYRLERLKVAYDPWSDAQKFGYQTVQSLSAIGSGELTGMGLGVGFSKYDYLPEAHTDFAFAIFCQENGFLGAFFVFMLFAAFTIYAARIASKANDIYGQALSMGIMILVVGQAIGNLFMVGGMFPVVGIPLPFISYGGTSLLVTMASIGILVNIGKIGTAKRG